MLCWVRRGVVSVISLMLLAADYMDPSATHVLRATAVGTGWQDAARRSIAEQEYRPSQAGAELQAPNRRHNLRTYFGPAGIRIHDRTGPREPALLRLRIEAIGRGDRLMAVARGRLASAHGRVEIRHPGLVESYVNSPQGLQQELTLLQRPTGQGALVIDLETSGTTGR